MIAARGATDDCEIASFGADFPIVREPRHGA